MVVTYLTLKTPYLALPADKVHFSPQKIMAQKLPKNSRFLKNPKPG